MRHLRARSAPRTPKLFRAREACREVTSEAGRRSAWQATGAITNLAMCVCDGTLARFVDPPVSARVLCSLLALSQLQCSFAALQQLFFWRKGHQTRKGSRLARGLSSSHSRRRARCVPAMFSRLFFFTILSRRVGGHPCSQHEKPMRGEPFPVAAT